MKNLVLFGIFSLAALSVSAQELLMSEQQDDWVQSLKPSNPVSPSLTVLPSSESNMRTKAVEKDA